MRVERVYGERFASVQPTPLLAALIEAARGELEKAAAPGTEVAAGRAWEFGPGTELVPSIIVARANGSAAAVPDLVVEFRTESTGRYVLGPKRLVYSRFRVPEFWYVDPLRRRVAVLRAAGGGQYGWPPEEWDEDAVLEPCSLPGVRVPVRALVGSSITPLDGDAWLER
jgi:Uma2 family endonuclease